ncbi:MAG TPA: hypothetical protein DCQ53_15550 [Alphaproteobacteria bacterium]|jgi:hypothetical protein|nr:hypothetical protein [Alphaproteobacteria bacterium]|tara:strand:- start:79 stop:924 length:846 start_codon:yes stop_codon:yes gene_type:complete
MKHAIVAIVAGLAVTACATTSSQPGISAAAPPPGASAAFDYAPSRNEAPRIASSRFGYDLAGENGWSGEMRFIEEGGEALIVLTLYDADGAPTAAELTVDMPYLSQGVRRFSGETNAGQPVRVSLQAGPCEQSGARPTHYASIDVNGTAMSGCATETAQNDRWSLGLMDFLTAIDACLMEVPEADHVTIAQPSGGGVGVRLSNRNGERWECNTRANGRVNAVRTLDPSDALLGEGDPIFVRSVMPQNGVGCYAYEAVRHGDGRLIGAFGYDTCIGPGGAIG